MLKTRLSGSLVLSIWFLYLLSLGLAINEAKLKSAATLMPITPELTNPVDDVEKPSKNANNSASANEISRPKGMQKVVMTPDGKWTTTRENKLADADNKPLHSGKLLERYIKKDCDFQNDGAEGCYITTEPRSYEVLKAYEDRRRLVFMGFAVAMLLLVILIQWIIRVSTDGVSKSRDRYLKNYEEAVFKQISCVLLVVALVEIAIQSHFLGDRLENAFFGDIKRELHFALSSITSFSHVEYILDSLLLISLIFASLFLLFAAFLAFCAFGINRWLRKADAIDVQNAALKIEGSEEAVNFLALRYEFEDAVQQSCVPGLDPPGLYFQNYCRACTYHVASKLLLIPSSTLLIAFCVTSLAFFTPMTSFAHLEEIIAMVVMASIPFVTLCLVCIRVWFIKRKLVPSDLYKYLQVRIALDTREPSESINIGPTSEISPPYRYVKTNNSTCLPNSIANFVYGTRFPNNHEVLMFFWRRGPGCLLQICEMSIFVQLVTLSFAFVLCTTHSRIWLDMYWPWAPISVFGICFLQWLLLPSLLWNLVLVTCTSGLIDDSILQKVWETQRARTVHRFRNLIDTLRCEANLFKIEKGGRKLRENWNDRCQFEGGAHGRQDDIAFRKLDPTNPGLLTRGHLFRYLSLEGVPVKNEKDAQRWVAAFDRRNKGSLDREDFAVLAWNVRTLMDSPLDIDSVTALFCERYGFSQEGMMDVPMLAAIFDKWRLNWTKVHVLHLFQYMTGKRGIKSINVKVFLRSLRILESNTIGTLRQAVGDLTTSSSYDTLSDAGLLDVSDTRSTLSYGKRKRDSLSEMSHHRSYTGRK